MNIKRNIRIATVAAVAVAGLGAGTGSPAMADDSITTTGSGSVEPAAKETWSACWRRVYFKARDDGFTVSQATAKADAACGATALGRV